jgi:hypothetical protein
MRFRKYLVAGLFLVLFPQSGKASQPEQICRWRAEVERIYHDARLGPKRSFEEEFTSSVISVLVNEELHKEAVLQKVYGVQVTEEMIEEEAKRINVESRAPEMLSKIKAVIGPGEAGFTETVVKPIIVERLLRQKYYQDEPIHAAERASATDKRQRLQAGKSVEGLEELNWLLGKPPEGASEAPDKMVASQIKSSGGPYTNEATVQVAEVIGEPEADETQIKNFYFDELEPELREVLKTQLSKAGDVSSVIETPEGFSIYRAKELTTEQWRVEAVFIPRKSYDVWLRKLALP